MRKDVIDWLLESDPSIRFQTKRDILGLPKKEWIDDRRTIEGTGWGKSLLNLQDPDGKWGGGLYGPKFINALRVLKIYNSR